MKKNTKKLMQFMSFILVATMLFTSCGKSEDKGANGKEPLTVALSDDYKPMEFRDDENNLVGFDVDLIEALSAELGRELVIETVAWDGIFVGLNADKYDMIISAISITDERLEGFEMSEPYLASGQVLVVNKDNENIKATEELAGKKVGVQIESTGAQAAQALLADTDFEINEYDEIVSVFNDLKVGRIDAAVADSGVVVDYVKANPDVFVVTGVQLSAEPLAVTFKKGNTELKAEVDKALAGLKESGKLKEISEKWFEADFTSNIK